MIYIGTAKFLVARTFLDKLELIDIKADTVKGFIYNHLDPFEFEKNFRWDVEKPSFAGVYIVTAEYEIEEEYIGTFDMKESWIYFVKNVETVCIWNEEEDKSNSENISN
jgi:hypothetical protein